MRNYIDLPAVVGSTTGRHMQQYRLSEIEMPALQRLDSTRPDSRVELSS